MSNSRTSWQQRPPGSANSAYSTPPARVSDSRQQFGSERHLAPRSATALGRSQHNGLAVNTNRLSYPAAPLSARTHSPAAPARGRAAVPHSIGRRMSEAGNTLIANYSPTTYGRGNTRPQAYADALYQPASANVPSSEWGEPFPGMHYSSYDSTISDMHTPHAEQRPGSRGSMYSTTSASTFQHHLPLNSGKAPYLVERIKVDAKVVPPQLDAIKTRRRNVKALHSSKRPPGPPHARQQARVRVRMDVDVKILHSGEQSLDLLWIGQAQQVSQQPSRRHYASALASAAAAGSQVHVERAVYSAGSASDYQGDLATSPLSSPSMGVQSLQPAPLEYGEPDGSKSSSLESTSAVPAAPFHEFASRAPTRKPEARARQPPVFHANAVSPYPPPPLTLAAEPRPGASSQAAASALPSSSTQQQLSSRYELHTTASYNRAQARVSDRAAIYSDLNDSSLKNSLLARRTLSFNTESGLDGLTNAMAQRPSSALGEMPGLHHDSQPHAERPRSSMGFVRQRHRANSEVIPSTAGFSVHPDRGGFRPSHAAAAAMGKQPLASSARSLSEYSGEYDVASRAPLCEFGADFARGVFVAHFYEPRFYRLTVWFSMPADAMPMPGDQELPIRGATPDSANYSASACPDTPPSMPTLYSWETGSVLIRGLPRSIKTTVRVRLPHRQMVVHEPAAEANGRIMLGFADSQPFIDVLASPDGSGAPPATPKRQIMQVNIADVPSSIYSAKPLGSSLKASNLSSVSDIAGSGRGPGCFYRVKMQRPGHVEPHTVRTESARLASTRAPVRAPSLLLHPVSPGAVPLDRGVSAEGELAGWLNTDDSDAAETDLGDFAPPPPPSAAASTAYELPCGDIETLLDNRLQRFIDEYGHRDLTSDEQPLLVDSNGRLDSGDAALRPSRPRSRAETHQALMGEGGAARPSWTDFAQQQTLVDGIDYQRTELTVFKLKLADCISFSWAPRLSEYCYPLTSPDKDAQAEVSAMMPPASDAIVPGLDRLLRPPSLPLISAPRHSLETIFSAESTPFGSSRLDSAAMLTFSEPQAAVASALPVNTRSSNSSAPAAHVSIERTELGVTLHAGGLRVQSTISLRLHSPAWAAEDEAVARSDQLYDWPEHLDLEFASLRLLVGGVRPDQCASTNTDLLHRSVTICCATQSEHAADWVSGAMPTLGSSSRVSPGALRPSRLRVWIPGTEAQLSPVLVLTIESEPATTMLPSSMLLTERLLVAFPKRLASLAALSTPADAPGADAASSESKLTKLVNRAGLWVKASVVDSEDNNYAILSALDNLAAACHIVEIERRSAGAVSGLAPALDRQQQLVAAYSELSNNGAILTPLTSPTSAAVGIVVGSGGGKQGESVLSVQVMLKCSLATFVPWHIQLGSSASAIAIPCLALRLPCVAAGCAPWVISGLELAGAAGDSGRMASTQLIALDSTLVVIPLTTRRQPGDMLNEEVVVDTVQCVLTTSINRDQLQPAQGLTSEQAEHGLVLPLPTLLFDASDVASVCKALATDDSLCEYSSISRLSGSLLSTVLVSVAAPCLHANGTALPTPRLTCDDTIVCSIDAVHGVGSGDSQLQDGTPLADHHFQLAGCTPLSLHLVPAISETRPELATKYVDTTDLEPPRALDASNAGSIPGSCPIADVATCSGAEAGTGNMLAVAPASSGDEQVDEDGALDVPTPDSTALAHGADTSSIDSNSGGSLRNRHARARVEQPTDLGGLFQAPPATETDPLLVRGALPETTSAISLSDSASGPTRSWRAALMALRTVVCIVVIGALMLLAKDRLFSLPAHSGWPMRGSAVGTPAIMQQPLAMAAPETAAPIDLSSYPIYISVISPPPQDAGPIRFRAHAKHSGENRAQVPERQEDAPATITSVMSNEGAHSFVVPTADATPLLGWLYKSVIGSVLELLGF